MLTSPGSRRSLTLDGIDIDYDRHVLAPRRWTVGQGVWAAELSAWAPAGPILELCSGVGHIGLVAARRTGRSLVQVDADGRACRHALRNAERAGLSRLVDVRCSPMRSALGRDERFPLIIADPPYLRSGEIDRFPHDPPLAVDGGSEGLDLILECLDVIDGVLEPGGIALIQVGGPRQAVSVRRAAAPGLVTVESRYFGTDRAVVLLRRAENGQPGPVRDQSGR